MIPPPSTVTTSSLKWKIFNSANNLVQEFKGSLTFTADPGALTMLNSSPLSTSSVLTAPTDLTFEIKLAHVVQPDSWIYVTIPDSVAVKADPNVMTCFKVVSSVSSSYACQVVSTANSQVVIKMREFCSSGSECPVDTVMKI